jgi:hypothetical protein
VPLDTTVGDGETELLTILAPGIEVEAGQTQPTDGEVFQGMTDFEDAQRAAGELGTDIHWRIGIFELEGTLAGNTEAGSA